MLEEAHNLRSAPIPTLIIKDGMHDKYNHYLLCIPLFIYYLRRFQIMLRRYLHSSLLIPHSSLLAKFLTARVKKITPQQPYLLYNEKQTIAV